MLASKDITLHSGNKESLESIVGSDSVNLTAQTNPFSTKQLKLQVPEGGSLSDMLKISGIDSSQFLHVFVNDWLVPRSDYEITFPKGGDIIAVKVILGDSGGDKNPLRTIAMIAVMIVAIYAGGVAGAAYGKFWGAVVTGVVSVAGSLAVNALIPLPTAQIDSFAGGNSSDKTYALVGTRNQILPFGCVPRVLGQARIWPPRAAAPYTEIKGGAQYLREIYCLGTGPLTKSNLKIGETDASNFTGLFEYEYLTGSQVSTLYPDDTTQKDLSILLDKYSRKYGDPYGLGNSYWYFDFTTAQWTTQTTEQNTIEITLDLLAPGLLYIDPKGRRSAISVWISIQIKPNGSGSWAWTTNGVSNVRSENLNVLANFTDQGIVEMTGNSGDTLRSSVTFTVPNGYWDIRMKCSSLWGKGSLAILANPEEDERLLDDIYWTSLKSISNSDGTSDNAPCKPQNQNIEYVAIRIKATEQLNGSVDTFNVVCQAHHPVYNGATWSIQSTRNPAWVYASILTDSSNKRALAYSKLNGSNLLNWANECTTNNFNCDGVLTSRAPIREILKQISAVGLASPGMPGEMHGVVRDIEQTIPIQVFTPRNSWGYRGNKVFIDIPHAFRCKFVNTIGQPDEVVVYDDGYDITNATKFETLDFAFINNADHVWRLGRYHLAVIRLRPEVHQINVDMEHIVCTRGDMVGLSHDAPSIGLGSTRIKSITIDGTNVTIVVDEIVTMIPGKNYGILVRTNTDPVSCQINTVPGNTYTLTCTLAPASSAKLAIDNLLIWGELNIEYAPMIVRDIYPSANYSAILYLVDASPGIHDADTGTIPPWESHITLPIDWPMYPPPTPIIDTIISDESVMNYDSNGNLISRMIIKFTSPGVIGKNQPVRVQVQYRIGEINDSYDDRQNNTVYNLASRMVYNNFTYECVKNGTSAGSPPSFTEVPGQTTIDNSVTWMCIGTDTTARMWQDAQTISYDSRTAVIFPVEAGQNYDVRLRFYSEQGIPGDWVSTTHIIQGGTNPPGTPTGLDGIEWMGGIKFVWDSAIEIDFSYWNIRTQIEEEGWSNWERKTNPAHYIFLNETQNAAYPNGARVHIEIIAYDTAENYSNTARLTDITGAVYVPPTAITDISQVSGAFPEIPVLTGNPWSNNTPSAGYVSWSTHDLYYNGNKYSIAAGSTSDNYIFWNNTDTSYLTSQELPTLGPGDFLIGQNTSGTFIAAWTSSVNTVIGSAYIKQAAIIDLHVKDVSAYKIITNTLLTPGVHIGNIYGGDTYLTSTNSTPDDTIVITKNFIGFHTTGNNWPVCIQNDDGVGKFYCGNGANRYLNWDGSSLFLSTDQQSAIVVKSGGSIEIQGGGDLLLIGNDTNPGKILFSGSSYDVIMGVNSSGDIFSIEPVNDQITSFRLSDYFGSGKFFYSLYLGARLESALIANRTGGGGISQLRCNTSSSTAPYVRMYAYNESSDRSVYFQNDTVTWFGSDGHKIADLGRSSAAWAEAYADNWNNVADIPFLDEVILSDGSKKQIDDIEIIRLIKPSNNFDPVLGLTLINDSSLPTWFVSKHRKNSEERIRLLDDKENIDDWVVPFNIRNWHWAQPGDRIRVWKQGTPEYSSDGRLYYSGRTMDGLLMGAIRSQDNFTQDLAAMIERLNLEIMDLKNKI